LVAHIDSSLGVSGIISYHAENGTQIIAFKHQSRLRAEEHALRLTI
jgi:hypothetical protein